MQILVVDRVVPLERRHGFVPGDRHAAEVIDARPPHSRHKRMPQVVKNQIGDASLPTRRLEGRLTAPMRLPACVKTYGKGLPEAYK